MGVYIREGEEEGQSDSSAKEAHAEGKKTKGGNRGGWVEGVLPT